MRSAREAQRELRSADLKKVVVRHEKKIAYRNRIVHLYCSVFCLENLSYYLHENRKRGVRRPGNSLDAYLDRQKIDTA